jgi:hypothetical protein
MNIFNHFRSGASRSVRSWRWILVIWSVTLFLVSILALTMRGEMNGIFGKSMITEKLANGFNLDAIANSYSRIQIIISSFTTGFMLVILFGLLLNVFFNGGLFSVLGRTDSGSSHNSFFAAAASNFWSFLLIGILLTLMLTIVSFLLVGLPVIISMNSTSGGSSIVMKISFVIMFLILPVFLLVADYARAWQASAEKKNAFIAVGQGFKNTFSHFFSSWLVMLILLIIQSVYTLLVLKFVGGFKPVSSGGIFLMFLLIQVLFIIRICLRTWRYGAVSSMFAGHNTPAIQ